LTPLIFSPFGIKYQKEKKKEEKSLITVGVNAGMSSDVGV
jgi:hypothetical protein